MEPREHFTSDEIESLLAEAAAEIETHELDLAGEARTMFVCSHGFVQFTCLPISPGPFHPQMRLSAFKWTKENPFEFSNNFNNNAYLARAYVTIDDDGTLFVDDDGDFQIEAELCIPFLGTVTPEHVIILIRLWIEDLNVFFEVDLGEDELEETGSEDSRIQEGSISDQILSVLAESPGQTARQLARVLGTTRNDVNRTLYGSPALFTHDSGQPPRWSTRS